MMKKTITVVITLIFLLSLIGCKLESLVGKTFVYGSFEIVEEVDYDPSKKESLENIFKLTSFSFDENKMTLQYMDEGEVVKNTYNYTYENGKLIVDDKSINKYSIKNSKLYLETKIDANTFRIIYKIDK